MECAVSGSHLLITYGYESYGPLQLKRYCKLEKKAYRHSIEHLIHNGITRLMDFCSQAKLEAVVTGDDTQALRTGRTLTMLFGSGYTESWSR